MIHRKQTGYFFPFEDNHFNGVFRGYKKAASSFNSFVYINATSSDARNSYNIMYPFSNTEPRDLSWLSFNEENSSIYMRFRNHKMSVLSYSLRSRVNCPINWSFEALNNAGKWEIISEISNDYSLKSNAIGHWNTTNNNFYSTFRIRQIGKRVLTDGSQDHAFEFSLIEFFGSLIRNELCSAKIRRSTNSFVTVFVLLIYS